MAHWLGACKPSGDENTFGEMTAVELYREMTAQGLSVSQGLLEDLIRSGLYEDTLERLSEILTECAGHAETAFQKDRRRARLSLAWDRVVEQVEMHRDRPGWVDALPDFEGEKVVDGERLEMAAWDFGKVRRRRPAAVLRPKGTEDVMSKQEVSGRKTSWWICGREVSMSERGADWIILENALLSNGLADGALRFGGTGIGLYPF